MSDNNFRINPHFLKTAISKVERDKIGSGDGITDDICVTELPQGFEVKTAVWLDHNQVSRSAMGEEVFRIADTKICIDHHKTAERFGDYCYIDSKAAA